ncbi:hypothetical protein BB559_007321 [Furculomyces boomerangus]|uniref:Uncharacterized protein n=2 Tax=Harpellales TaxID=61421 RepID=A0A2T9XXS1_9FUNG|nr:hypothetical protein BB559_007321 [Furculomyces boomerangus]PVZ99809.1 hypothetical protein BB558_004157 [Smittium angustum]
MSNKKKEAESSSKEQVDLNPQDIPQKNTTAPKIFPGSLGAPVFDGKGLPEFLIYYDIITADISTYDKTILLPYYCTQEIRSKVIKSTAYTDKNWVAFKNLLEDYFSDEDNLSQAEKDLTDIVKKGTNLKEIKTFLHQFEFLLKKLSRFQVLTDREKKELLIKSIETSEIEKIRTLLYSEDGSIHSYDEISKRLKTFASMEKSLSNIIGNRDDVLKVKVSNQSEDNISQLTKIMENLCLKLDSIVENKSISASTTPRTDNSKRIIRCIYCDGDHRKFECDFYLKDLETGLIKNNKGVKMPTNWGKGGIKALINSPKVNSRHIKIMDLSDDENFLEWDTCEDNMEITKSKFVKLVNSFASKRVRENKPNNLEPKCNN